jgi:formimidoylglutamate deiminase
MLPGLINAHSHAFQRTLRGRTEWREASTPENFWSWRTQMYRVAGALDPDGLRIAARLAFTEMVLAGITTVGEFHYLHRDRAGRPFTDPNEMGWQLRAAAEEVGIRLVLLRVAYRRGNHRAALEGPQRRFDSGEVDRFFEESQALASRSSSDLFRVGVAPHSVRALSAGDLAEVVRFGRARGWAIHMHLAEQPGEVSACLEEHGRRPAELCADLGILGPDFTAVHAIECLPHEVAELGKARANVCACPTTERNLGDRAVPAQGFLDAGATLSVGTDSQVQIDLLEDAREVELNLRLTLGQRMVLGPVRRYPGALAALLFDVASVGGSKSLGVSSGALVPGAAADFFTMDLADPSIAEADDDALLSSIVFGGSPRAVRDVAVRGRFVVRDGHHPITARAVAEFARLQDTLWS